MRLPACVAVCALATGLLASPRTIDQESLPPIESKPPIGEAHIVARRIERSLAWANEQNQAAVDRQMAAIVGFFTEARRGTRPFADSVLGWGSKWRFVADKVPFTRGDRHEIFLRKQFQRHLFEPDDLARIVEQAIRDYSDELLAIENQMLVRMRRDVGDLPPASAPAFSDADRLSAAYQDSLSRAMTKVGAELKADVATTVLSVVTQEVLTQVAVRMGVSAGVLGAGAASSWATLGVGLVVGLIVDQMISWVWDWCADPRGALATEMAVKLTQLQRLLINGDELTKGLRGTLGQFARDRGELRREAVAELVNGRL